MMIVTDGCGCGDDSDKMVVVVVMIVTDGACCGDDSDRWCLLW